MLQPFGQQNKMLVVVSFYVYCKIVTDKTKLKLKTFESISEKDNKTFILHKIQKINKGDTISHLVSPAELKTTPVGSLYVIITSLQCCV